MASSSTSDQLDLEKAAAAAPSHTRDNATTNEAACLGSNEEKACEGWAAGQEALAPACSRTNSHVRAAEDEGHNDARSDDEDDDHQHDDGVGGGGGVVGRVLSRITSKSSIDPGPPPDGGWLAWTQCK